jgi:hypothetical protein
LGYGSVDVRVEVAAGDSPRTPATRSLLVTEVSACRRRDRGELEAPTVTPLDTTV